MSWSQPNPADVQAALAWLREQDPRLSLDALARQLRAAGYGDAVVVAAIASRQAELDAALPPGSDLRGRATAVLVVAFLATWGVITLWLVTGPPSPYLYGAESLAALILGAMLLPMLLLGLALVRVSGRLRRGAAGAMAIVLAVPFIYLVVIAGTCIAATQPWQ